MIYKNLKEAESLLRGHIGFTEVEDHGICAARFTEDQLAFYKQLSEHDYIRSHVLAGISLDFITDASEISFEYEFIGTVNIVSGFDIYEDGIYSANIPTQKTEETVTVSYTVKNPGSAHIVIRFPHGSAIVPKNLSLGNARPYGDRPAKLALFYGDSITQAAYISESSLTWATFIAQGLDAQELNRGIGSFYFEKDSLPEKADCAPEWLFVEYGFNDLAKFADDEANYKRASEYLDRINELYPAAKKYVITTEFGKGAATTDEAFARRHVYCREIEKIALSKGMKVINGATLVPTLPIMFVADYVHLSEAGCGVFANNLLNAVRKSES